MLEQLQLYLTESRCSLHPMISGTICIFVCLVMYVLIQKLKPLFLFPFPSLGENTILVLIFWGHYQFSPYILIVVNFFHFIFNL